jgi:alkaline phosphatase
MRIGTKYVAGIVLMVCLSASALLAGEGAPARGLVLFIGDGMGPQIVSIVKLYAEEELHQGLNMILLGNSGSTGYMSTNSADRLVTDSAASGTAIATGHRTNNGMVGMTPDGETVANLFEDASAAGKSVGVVTTTSVTDATPASFLAHVPARGMHFDIARQIIESGASVVLGGGRSFFMPPEMGKRKDGTDLTEQARSEGFDVVFDREGMMSSSGDRILGLFASGDLPFELARNGEEVPSLTEMTLKAMDILGRDPDGFVLMVEGGLIDHAEHENSISDAVGDFLAFDQAIGEAMKYQAEDSTLAIVITADHDCGSPAITAAGYGYPSYNQVDKITDESSHFVRWVSGDHTGTMVPVFAVGPDCVRFSGIRSNADLHDELAGLLGL